MSRTYKKTCLTVGDLREFLDRSGLDDDAVVWIGTNDGQMLVATELTHDLATVPPDEGDAEEALILEAREP